LVCNANTTQAVTDICVASARVAAGAGTEIVGVTAPFGPAIIATRAENAIAGHAVLATLAEHAAGTDAAVLAVSYDTALEAARQLMPFPVVGMTEAACLTACLVGGRFGLVTFSSAELYRERIAQYGLAARLAGIRVVSATPMDMASDPHRVDALVAEAAAALAVDGADAVLLGGAALAGADKRVDTAVPLIDGIAAGVRMAEMLVRLGLPRARSGSYAAPQGRETEGLSPALARLLLGG
jgi:allantoin racemase